PFALVRARFPQLLASAFPEPPTSRARERARQRAPQAPAPIGAMLPRLTAPPAVSVPTKSTSSVPVALAQGISFQYVPLIQCSFPHADPREIATFTRRNGWLELTLSAPRRHMGLPYGVLAWDEAEAVGPGSSLVLSSVLFQSILERSAPLSTAAIRQLRKSPMDLDVYAWLVHRLFHLSRPNTVTCAQLSGQFGHGYAQPRKFRHFFLDSLKRVLAVYPEAHVKPVDVGLIL